ncbi:MAG: AI-2E family transporter, partial [Pseudomonadales bacterium]|nr:AI-2E family transporter [Pseudomonadales bacterium]
MSEEDKPSTRMMQRLAGLGLLLVAGLLLHLLAPILMPFLVATALAYLWDPAVDRLERLGMGRGLCVSLVFFLMSLLLILLVLVLVPLLGRQMHVVAAKVPLAIDWFKLSLLPWLEGQFNVGAGDIPLEKIKQALMANWQSAGGV